MDEVVVETSRLTPVSFDEFVAARGDALWRSAWLLTGDMHRAEDLVQTALGKAWPHWDRVSRDGSFEGYVRRTLYTTYVAWYRRRWNAELPIEHLPEQSSDDNSERISLQRDVVAALARLPRGQRAVVVLRYFEDLTEARTAAVLGCSVGTVKSQAARARHTAYLPVSDVRREGPAMNRDFERSLRAKLAAGIPDVPPAPGRSTAARRYAAQRRRTLAAGASAAIVILVATLFTVPALLETSTDSSDRGTAASTATGADRP